MQDTTLGSLLDGFQMTGSGERPSGNRRAVTIWLTAEDCARFTRLQEMSNRRFGKCARRALLQLMEIAERKTSEASAA